MLQSTEVLARTKLHDFTINYPSNISVRFSFFSTFRDSCSREHFYNARTTVLIQAQSIYDNNNNRNDNNNNNKASARDSERYEYDRESA